MLKYKLFMNFRIYHIEKCRFCLPWYQKACFTEKNMMPNNSSQLIETIIHGLEQELPVTFQRRDIPRYIGNSLAVGTLANIAAKNGPPFIRKGNKAIYERSSFLEWYAKWLASGEFCRCNKCADGDETSSQNSCEM